MGGNLIEMHPSVVAFYAGLDLILENWESLEDALLQQRKGYRMRDKYDKLGDEIFYYFDGLVRNRQVPNTIDVMNMLVDVLDRYFDVMLEDNSDMDVASELCRLFDECKMGNYATVDTVAEEQSQSSRGLAAQQPQATAQQVADNQ
ncbi:rRNA accumulation- protein [Coemansia sp. RSA 1972]|nr:rRNA accumulation- protein [Coemansia sp. RSA 1972]